MEERVSNIFENIINAVDDNNLLINPHYITISANKINLDNPGTRYICSDIKLKTK